jgi:LuxR family transcriptional regulator, maltose regulon positive regulatory protein
MLLTKLHIPPVGNNVVHRSELFEKLNTGLSRKLILVSAPAGFGKTMLLSDWINQNKIPTAWISIDNGDNDPVKFLNYIISGIQGVSKEFGQRTLKLLNSPNKPSIESITSLLINDILNINQNFLLVLEDFHLIKSNEVVKLVTYLLEYIPGNIHIVILTRSDPALSVSRLRSQQLLVELRSSDLSFSANDISILFNKKLKLGLSIEDVYSLETKTEGWIAGLQLTGLSMQGRENISEFIRDLKGDNRYIMDYLMEEVLKIQNDNNKEFLLQTSILEQMSASLCNAVLNRNDSQLTLEWLDKNNMFVIPLDNERNWYRYHHLFADLLKQRLQQKGKTTIVELHNGASVWFKNNSMPLLAINHAIEAGNFEKSIQFLGEIIESMWENGQHSSIIKYGELLPDELILQNSEICLYYSWVLIKAGQIQKARPFLLNAETISLQIINDLHSSKEEIHYNKKLLGKTSVALAYLNSFAGSSELVSGYCKRALENLSEDDPLWFSWGWYSMGIAESASAKFNNSIAAYEKALEYGKKSGNIFLISTIAMNLANIETRMGFYTSAYKKCSELIAYMGESGYSQFAKTECTFAGLYSCLAGIELMRTDFDEALENINTAYILSKKESNVSHKIYVLMVFSLVLWCHGDLAGAIKKTEEAESIMKHNKIAPAMKSVYVGMKAFYLIEQNQLDKANVFFKDNGLELEKTISYYDENGYVTFALLLISELKFNELEILLNKLKEIAEAANRIERLIELKIFYAILYKNTGKKDKAIASLIESLEYAARDNIIGCYVFYYDKISDLLTEVYRIQATAKTNIPQNLLFKLKLAIEKRHNRVNNRQSEELSTRELEILKLIAKNLSNQEIADQLFISLNTVKTHLKNINLKLEVDSRSKAAARAMELGFI